MVSNMKFDDAVLSSYLIQKLQPLTEANPNLLARYVAALLKNNKPRMELEALCIEKLFDFLGDESKAFVQNLFHAFEKGTIPKLNNDCGIKVAEVAGTIPVNLAATMMREAACTGGVTNGTSYSQMRKLPEADNVVSDDLEEEGSDDEDDDRNHKHRRQVSMSHALNREHGSSAKEHEKPEINVGPPAHDSNIPVTESPKALSFFNTERNGTSKRLPHYDQAYLSPFRYIRQKHHHGLARGAIHLRELDSRSEHQNKLSQEMQARGRVAFVESPIAPEQRTALNGLDFNLPLLSLGSTLNPYAGKSISSRLNASQSSWAGIGQFPGPYDQLFPLNQVMQDAVGLTVGCSRCPDFEEKGYCLRGDLCPMEHGANRIVVEDFQSLSKLNLPLAIPYGRDMTLNTSSIFTSSFTSNLSNPILFTRERNLPMVDGPVFLKGTLTDSFSEPDSYDPDQPLFSKEQPSAFANGVKRLSSFRKDLEDNEGVLKRHREGSHDEGRYSSCLMPGGLTQGQMVLNYVRHNSHDINSADSNNRRIADAVEAERDTFVESYEPESVCEKNCMEEEESLVKSANVKPGMSHAPIKDVGLYSTGLKSCSRWTVGAEDERAHRTLYVGCIPKVNNKKGLLNAHFQKFGEVVDIRIPVKGDRAFIQFSQREEAEAALKSPEAVMGNRFVRLSWAKRDNVPFSSADSGLLAPSMTGHCLSVEPDISKGFLTEASLIKAKQTAPPESNRLTAAAGKSIVPSFQTIASPSSRKKQHELELMMEELRRKQDALADKREDFRRQLERYSKQGFGVVPGLQMDQRNITSSSGSKAESNEDQTSSKLEILEAGSDKSHKEISALSASTVKTLLSADLTDSVAVKGLAKIILGPAHLPISTRLSQRGVVAPLAGTGVSLSGASQSSTMRHKLDNCTTAFHVLPPFPDGLVDVSIFTEHFSCFGDLSSVEVDDVNKGVKVTFYTRSAAERAFLQGRCYKGTSLCFSWIKRSSSITAGASSVDTVATGATGNTLAKLGLD